MIKVPLIAAQYEAGYEAVTRATWQSGYDDVKVVKMSLDKRLM